MQTNKKHRHSEETPSFSAYLNVIPRTDADLIPMRRRSLR